MERQNLIESWNVVTTLLKPDCVENLQKSEETQKTYQAALEVLRSHDMVHALWEWFVFIFKEDLHEVIIPNFWECFANCTRPRVWKFPEALNDTYGRLQTYYRSVYELQMLNLTSDHQSSIQGFELPLMKELFTLTRCLLFAKWPVDFRAALVEFYVQAFKSYQCQNKIKVDDNEQVPSCYCKDENDVCCCGEFLNEFYSTTQKLHELNFFRTVIGDVPINVAQDFIEKHIQDTCKGNFEVSYLKPLKKWLNEVVISWLGVVYQGGGLPDSSKVIDEYKNRLLNVLYESFAEVCMEQLFDIIIEFPESQAALEDLKECLEITNLRSKLIATLRSSLETRLLHPGVNTADIVTAYISAIKALRVLDHTGVVLQVVSEPVCIYLRSREDTIRCIISSLREDSCGELACELMKGVPLKLEENYQSDEEVVDWESWCPDPVDADPTKTTESQRSSDIISILVNIYGSKELFVNEYRSILADRILTTFSYNTAQEIRYLELLKLRFGESQLHLCEVMLKDIADSKRLNTHLNSEEAKNYEKGEFPVNTMILSAQFWPSFKEERLRLPEYIWLHLKNYTKAFEALKGNRTLVWKPHLGSVELEIELEGRTVQLTASPVHTTILWHFQEKPRWSVKELSEVMLMQPSVLRRKITFWQNHGLLREEDTDIFVLTEGNPANRDSVVIEEEEESVTASSQDLKEEELQTFWSFIVGMLTNMDSLPLERIHSMLRMFAVQGTSTNECSLQEVKHFLEKKVKERQLVFQAGLFRLPK